MKNAWDNFNDVWNNSKNGVGGEVFTIILLSILVFIVSLILPFILSIILVYIASLIFGFAFKWIYVIFTCIIIVIIRK